MHSVDPVASASFLFAKGKSDISPGKKTTRLVLHEVPDVIHRASVDDPLEFRTSMTAQDTGIYKFHPFPTIIIARKIVADAHSK